MTNGEYLKQMFENNLFAVIYPKEKTKAAAEKLATLIDSAVGVAKIEKENEKGTYIWGVLIDKAKAMMSKEK